MFLNAKISPWISVVGGRFANPFMHTDLVYDPDLPFDGIAAKFKYAYQSKYNLFGTLGYFPLEEFETSEVALADSKWLLGAQAGVKWKTDPTTSVKLGLAYYDFNNVEAIPNPNGRDLYDGTAPTFRTKGNSYFDINQGNAAAGTLFGLASQFELINVNAEIDIAKFNPVHVIIKADYVKNIGFDRSEIAKRTNLADALLPKDQTDGFQVRATVGMPEIYKKENWQAYIGYKYVEADAVLDSYTDSNFFLRGTNAKGFLLGAAYGLGERTMVQARLFAAEEIDPRNGLDPLTINVFNVDLMTRF